MSSEASISGHYTTGDLLARLKAALADDGADPEKPTLETLAPYDQFHGRGLEATEEVADGLSIAPGDAILDVGSGIGGPARYIARRFDCRVTGIDLTEEFCAVARHLTALLGLEETVAFEQGNALAMPFGDAAFAGAYSMNVSMNIADKAAFYGEIFRVLRPGGWLVLSEIARGTGGTLAYPTPWAETAASSFLATPAETETGLAATGFSEINLRNVRQQALDFAARSRAAVDRGEKPPHRAVMLMHGENAPAMAGNTTRGFAEEAIVPIEVSCRKPG